MRIGKKHSLSLVSLVICFWPWVSACDENTPSGIGMTCTADFDLVRQGATGPIKQVSLISSNCSSAEKTQLEKKMLDFIASFQKNNINNVLVGDQLRVTLNCRNKTFSPECYINIVQAIGGLANCVTIADNEERLKCISKYVPE